MTRNTALETQANSPGPTIEAFERLQINPAHFDHKAHVYVAWSYLQDYDLLSSIERYRSTLKLLTRKLGVPGKYHETLTWFFMVLVAERIDRDPPGDWEAFIGRNQDLFTRAPGIASKFYSSDRLGSAAARRQFLLPDLSTH